MFGSTSQITPADLRKKLLIAESDLNRAQLSQEWKRMTHEVRDHVRQAKTIASWASSASLLVAGVMAWRRGKAKTGALNHSWFQKVLAGLRAGSMIWMALRAQGKKEELE